MNVTATRNLKREIALFLIVIATLGFTGGLFDTTFNNFLSDTFRIDARARGALEFPRELPGFLVALLGGALFFLSEVRLGAFAALATCAGFLGLAFCGAKSGFGTMTLFLFVWSIGNHMMMPVSSTINLSLAPPDKRGLRDGAPGRNRNDRDHLRRRARVAGAEVLRAQLPYALSRRGAAARCWRPA